MINAKITADLKHGQKYNSRTDNEKRQESGCKENVGTTPYEEKSYRGEGNELV